MLELKSKSKLVFLLVMIFIVTFSICLMVFAAYMSGSYYWQGSKLCDYSISANLPVARYNGNNQWFLESSHALSIQSFNKKFNYHYGWGHGWCPVGGEGTWSNCDDKQTQAASLNENSFVSHTRYNWGYTEFFNGNQYRAISASIFKPQDYNDWAHISESRVVSKGNN